MAMAEYNRGSLSNIYSSPNHYPEQTLPMLFSTIEWDKFESPIKLFYIGVT